MFLISKKSTLKPFLFFKSEEIEPVVGNETYISYLLLHNKLSKNALTRTNISFSGSRI